MKKKFHFKRNINSGILMPGLFLFFLLTTAVGAPSIRYSLSESAGFINMSIMAYSLEPFKTGTITITYSSGIDIENASVATSVKSLSVGASIDKKNSILDITVSQTKKISIDSMVLISLKFASVASFVASELSVIEAQFKDYGGSTFNVPVSHGVKVINFYSGPKHFYTAPDGYYLLSGRKVTGVFTTRSELPTQSCNTNVRIVQKVDNYR